MQYSITIDQKRAIEWGLNLADACVFSLYTKAATWAAPVVMNGDVFYFVCRHKVAEELPILKGKKTAKTPTADTIYRINKKLSNLGLIEYRKEGVKDCIKITKKGSLWGRKDEESASEINPSKGENSEINPNELGNKSESASEINPTYQYNYIDQRTKDQREEAAKATSAPQVISEEDIRDFQEQEEQIKKKPRKRFQKPTLEELEICFQKKFREKKVLGYEKLGKEEAEKFYNLYESKGWVVGKNKMTSWRHAVGGWISRMKQYETHVNKSPKPNQNGIKQICSEQTAEQLLADFAAGGYRW